MLIAFVLCTLHLFNRTAVLLVLVLLAVVAGLSWRRAPTDSRPERSWSLAVVVVPLVAVFALLFVCALSPSPAWDADTYHLTVPRLYLEAGGFRPIRFNVYSNWPLNMELLYGLAMMFHDYVTATLLHFAVGVAVAMALVRGCALSRGPHARWAGWIAAGLFWANGTMQEMLAAAYVDLAVTFFFVAAFLFTWQASEETGSRGTSLLVAGVCAGILAGLKLNGVLGAGTVAVLFPVRQRSSWRLWLTNFCLPAALLASLWPLKSWVLTGNPIYPFLWGGPDWNAELTAKLQHWQLSLGMGRTPRDYLLLPFRVLLGSQGNYQHFAGSLTSAWAAVIPLTLVLGWRRPFVRACLGVAGLYFLVWASSSQQLRFLMPSFALLAMAGGSTLVALIERFAPARAALLVPVGAATGVLLLSSVSVSGRADSGPAIGWPGALAQAGKLLPMYLERGSTLPAAAIPAIDDYANQSLPDTARVLLLNTNRAFFLHRDFLADSFFEASQITAWLGDATTPDDVQQRLHDAGVSHIVFGGKDYGYPPALMKLLRERRGLTELFHDPAHGQSLLALCDPATCPSAGR
jgi:hypothetical protein